MATRLVILRLYLFGVLGVTRRRAGLSVYGSYVPRPRGVKAFFVVPVRVFSSAFQSRIRTRFLWRAWGRSSDNQSIGNHRKALMRQFLWQEALNNVARHVHDKRVLHRPEKLLAA